MPKRKDGVSVEQSIANINGILAQIKELAALVDDKDFSARLDGLYDKVEFSDPTKDLYIARLDRKISDALGDLKIQLTTRQGRSVVNHKMETVTQLINERMAKA
jgi:hypothetical protein